MKRKSYSTAIIISIIASAFLVASCLFGLIFFLNKENYNFLLENLRNVQINGKDYLTFLAEIVNMSENGVIELLYISIIVSSVFAMIITIPTLIFAIVCKKYENSLAVDFDKYKGKIKALIACLIVTFAFNSFNIAPSFINFLNLISNLSEVGLVIAVVLLIYNIKNNNQYLQSVKKQESEKTNVLKNDIITEEIINDSEKEIPLPNKDFSSEYDELAKIEREYKNGVINKEEYELKKQNVLKKFKG